jgi:MFS family permease
MDKAANGEGRKLRRIVFATGAGALFEGYDFILFGSLAPIISQHFFSGVNDTAAFIFALLTFAAGFAIRPLGALFFGQLGDRRGRKRAFLITITIMGLSTFGIGLLPTYATAGIFAPILLIALRLFQGLAFGGEYGAAMVYMAEHSPPHRRGLLTGAIQSTAGFALFLSFAVIYVTRTGMGEDAFAQWGWRIPFLVSIVLLIVSLWIRLTLEESPLFQKMAAEGKTSKRPVREAFSQWRYIKLAICALFGIMAVQGVLFYTAHFYSQFFLTQILKMPAATVTGMMMVITLLSVPFYLLSAWASDKVGRKPVLLTGAILAAVTMFPLFHGLTAAVNPQLAEARQTAPVIVVADPAACSLQFDPVGEAAFTSSCDIAKSVVTGLGTGYRNQTADPGTATMVTVGEEAITVPDGTGLTPPALAQLKADFRTRMQAALTAAGYPESADIKAINVPLVGVLVGLLVLFTVIFFASMASMAVELFPTRIRYSAMSLPYHIGSGWFGGFLPAIAFAMVAANGDIYFGLWYPFTIVVIGILVLAFLLPETRNRDMETMT